MIIVWVLALLAGVGATSLASRRAVNAAVRASETLNISPALVGMTVLAIGTDLPEIANSVVSSATGHGDVNVGDSLGSALTQVTLTLGLLCLAGGTIAAARRNFIIAIGTATVFAAVMVRVLVDDGNLSRVDGCILIILWLGGTALLSQGEIEPRETLRRSRERGAGTELTATIGWLAAVGAAAVVVVESFLRIAEALDIPEFVGSFVALSVGTSLPELFVDWTAIRRGASSMAVGGIFGSSFVDSTLSVGIGPTLFPVAVTSTVFAGTLLAALGVLAATLVVARSSSYDRRLGVVLLTVYVAIQTATIVGVN